MPTVAGLRSSYVMATLKMLENRLPEIGGRPLNEGQSYDHDGYSFMNLRGSVFILRGDRELKKISYYGHWNISIDNIDGKIESKEI